VFMCVCVEGGTAEEARLISAQIEAQRHIKRGNDRGGRSRSGGGACAQASVCVCLRRRVEPARLRA
jgi:hypothetical protein